LAAALAAKEATAAEAAAQAAAMKEEHAVAMAEAEAARSAAVATSPSGGSVVLDPAVLAQIKLAARLHCTAVEAASGPRAEEVDGGDAVATDADATVLKAAHDAALAEAAAAHEATEAVAPQLLDEARLSEAVLGLRAALRATPLADAVSMMRRGGGPAGEVRRGDVVRVVGELCAREHATAAAAAAAAEAGTTPSLDRAVVATVAGYAYETLAFATTSEGAVSFCYVPLHFTRILLTV
jgi:hypothetical protein